MASTVPTYAEQSVIPGLMNPADSVSKSLVDQSLGIQPSICLTPDFPTPWLFRSSDAAVAVPNMFDSFQYESSTNSPAVNEDVFATPLTAHLPLGGDYDIGGVAWDVANQNDVCDELLPEMLNVSPTTLHTFEDEEIRRDIQEYFDRGWFIFPLLSYEYVQSQLDTQPISKTSPEFRCLLLAIRLANATVEYRMTSENGTTLLDLIQRVETSRDDYDFAEPPTLDDVVVSTFLFVAFNILEKHVRAFLYLDEAISLLEEVKPVSEAELLRKQLIQQVLYNTEAASVAIYAHGSRRRRAKRPAKLLDKLPTTSSGSGFITQFDSLALLLLNRLSEIHLATDAEELQTTSNNLEGDLRTLFGVSLQHHQFCRIQAADVAVTHQWRLSQGIATCSAEGLSASRPSLQEIEKLGITAMAWVCSLKEGELRIVGLGKLSGLARAIHATAGNNSCDYIIAGLVGAVMKEDHDQQFTPDLAEVITSRMTIPLSILGPLPDNYAHSRLRLQKNQRGDQVLPLIMR
ncbi:hypothetical protein RBB50_010680 [Rhinocladiella similis]